MPGYIVVTIKTRVFQNASLLFDELLQEEAINPLLIVEMDDDV